MWSSTLPSECNFHCRSAKLNGCLDRARKTKASFVCDKCAGVCYAVPYVNLHVRCMSHCVGGKMCCGGKESQPMAESLADLLVSARF